MAGYKHLSRWLCVKDHDFYMQTPLHSVHAPQVPGIMVCGLQGMLWGGFSGTQAASDPPS